MERSARLHVDHNFGVGALELYLVAHAVGIARRFCILHCVVEIGRGHTAHDGGHGRRGLSGHRRDDHWLARHARRWRHVIVDGRW